MKYLTLKHKQIGNSFGHIVPDMDEIFYGSIPLLCPTTATLEGMRTLYANKPGILKQLEDYDLIKVNIVLTIGQEELVKLFCDVAKKSIDDKGYKIEAIWKDQAQALLEHISKKEIV